MDDRTELSPTSLEYSPDKSQISADTSDVASRSRKRSQALTRECHETIGDDPLLAASPHVSGCMEHHIVLDTTSSKTAHLSIPQDVDTLKQIQTLYSNMMVQEEEILSSKLRSTTLGEDSAKAFRTKTKMFDVQHGILDLSRRNSINRDSPLGHGFPRESQPKSGNNFDSKRNSIVQDIQTDQYDLLLGAEMIDPPGTPSDRDHLSASSRCSSRSSFLRRSCDSRQRGDLLDSVVPTAGAISRQARFSSDSEIDAVPLHLKKKEISRSHQDGGERDETVGKRQGILMTAGRKEQRRKDRVGKDLHVRWIDPKKQRNWISHLLNFLHSPAVLKKLKQRDRAMVLPLTYELWAFPFRYALSKPGLNLQLALDIGADVLFLLDMIIEKLIETQSKDHNEVQKLPEAAIVDPVYKASWLDYYCKNKIVFQYLSCLLLHPVAYAWSVSWVPIGVWWMASVPRLTRVVSLLRYFRKMEMQLEVDVRTLQFYKYMITIFLVTHWEGCIFYWLSRLMDFNSQTWVYKFQSVLPSFELDDSLMGQKYFVILYKGFNAMTNLAYENIVPGQAAEIILSILSIFSQMVFNAYILGTLFHYLVQKDSLSEEHKSRMDLLERFMSTRQLAQDLRHRLVRHFDFQFKKLAENKASKNVVLPKSLAIKVAYCQYHSVIEKCSMRGGGIFYECNEQFLNMVILCLREVYLMPGEEVAKQGDMSRDLSFVIYGSVQVMEPGDSHLVVREIRSDIPEVPPVVSEVAFFMGIMQPSTIRARLDGDVKLLTLSKLDYEGIVSKVPEQHHIITKNIVTTLGLDKNGEDIRGADLFSDSEEQAMTELKHQVADALQRRLYDNFAQLMFAARSGDLEEVKSTLRLGIDINMADYDGRTVLHGAAKEGNFNVVSLLLEEGAQTDSTDRWGSTPLQTAIENNQGPVVELLTQWKAIIKVQDPAGALCEAASNGDISMVQRLLDNGVDPNIGDYDMRTSLHLGAAEGQQKVVEYLIGVGAEVNIQDRWGGIPLMDAIENGNSLITNLIASAGGKLNDNLGADKMCTAAVEGDLNTLRLLEMCHVDLDKGNYDQRCALHLAAADGILMSVSYLLGIAANPKCRDRWGNTPLVDALRGDAFYCIYCAKLIEVQLPHPSPLT
ncbi:hypothetical protein CYMTET_53920 [Cymbomonas tetramitiformis]|uniref:Cyclic nucleotide-binding domain-containing protein n=1 Tax=Cymbomonas tetramitiformis TaxID=36881 RepID=A0AAE0BHU5_9CHLO|nr:hypothetical protein CYMTET_53920 [Cymbomonas tetramitiformis]